MAEKTTEDDKGVKRCPNFQGYSASADGRVFSHFVKSGIGGQYRLDYSSARALKGTDYRGYLKVTVKVGGKQRPIPVHVMVADAFIGPRPDGLEVRHLDGIKRNTRHSNLKYGSAKENGEDRAKLGESARGERNGATDFTAADVLEIRKRHAAGESCAAIGRSLQRGRSTIHAIVTRQSWKYL